MNEKSYYIAGKYIRNVAVLYFILDYAIRATGIFESGAILGIKNFLPTVAGLVLGGYGCIGCMIGSLLVSLLFHTPLHEILFEMCAIGIMSMGMWLLWYLGKKVGAVFLKKPKDYLRYLVILVFCSVLTGGISGIIVPECGMAAVFGYYLATGLFIGIPIVILLTSIICVSVNLPFWCKPMEAVHVSGVTAVSGLEDMNLGIEDYAQNQGIPLKQVFGIENCIEEVLLRIDRRMPGTGVDVTVNFHDSVSIRFVYNGKRYNPLRTDKGEGEEELIGVKLITHRALRASYHYHFKVNEIHIVA
jgi:hypothetical protein